MEWILTNNYLTFDNAVYLQIKGVAMGTPVAVCYANIVIFYLEQSNLSVTNPILYKRYIDDLFVICTDTQQANLITAIFNKQHPSIQLTAITVDTWGIFLDMKLSIDPISNRINVSLYQKETNKYLYIPPWSAHSKHIFINIIKNEIRRIVLLNSLPFNALLDIKKFRQRLLDRGFDHQFLKPLFDSNSIPHRATLLSRINSNNVDDNKNNECVANNSVNSNNNINGNDNDNIIDSNNINNNNNKSNSFIEQPFIITHLPQVSIPLLNELFRLPSSITNHPSYKKIYNPNHSIQIINSTQHNSINMYLNQR